MDVDDIDIDRPGLPASVRFSAFSQSMTFSVEGVVVDVSADQLEDERTGLRYFRMRVEVIGDLSGALDGAKLCRGMQAEVPIQTGEKTLLEYLVQPITQSLRRSVSD